ncbi:LysR family transcriptional regulator [Devosia sp. A449]
MKINLNQIVAFNSVVKLRSFSKAAKALGVTQSSVTQSIAKFEAVVGAHLLERRRTGLVLTPAGHRIHRVTEEMGLLRTQLDERISEFSGLEKGLLRVAATASNPSLAYMRRFSERHPGVDLMFENTSWRRCEEMLRLREADVVIMPEPANKENLYIWKIDQRRHVALVPPDHHLVARESISIAELAEHQIILASVRSFARWRLETGAARKGISLSKVMTVCSTAVAVEAVHNGLGITVTSQGASTLASKLVSLPIDELTEPYQIVAACNADTRDSRVVKGFFDCMD